MTLKLNLGCGEDIRTGFVNVDIKKRNGVDVVHDLNKKLPFKTSSVDYVYCSHVLEHLFDPTQFMLEVYRICKPGARIYLRVPHFSMFGTYADMTHIRPGFSYFIFGTPHWNKDFFLKFKVKAKLNFTGANYTFLNKFINPLINASPMIYERFFCYLLPCSEIHFKLEVIKPEKNI